MKYRTAKLAAAEDLGAAGTKIYNLDLTDIISRISIIGRYTNNATAVIADHVTANITKVEVVDGSDVLYSASGPQLQGMAFYDTYKSPYTSVNWQDSAVQATQVDLNFGHELYDPNNCLDPTQFNNPQLKLTWDENVADTSCADNTHEVWADLFDEMKPTPTGFCMVKELKEYAQVAAANEYTDLPVDFPYKQIYIQAKAKDKDVTDKIDEIELDINTKDKVPVNTTAQTLERMTQDDYGMCFEKCYISGEAATVTRYLMPTDSGVGAASSGTADQAAAIYHGSGITWYTDIENSTPGSGITHGNFPHGICPILKDNPLDKLDLLQLETGDHLKLRLKAGAASGTGNVQILARQVRSY